MKYGSLFNPFTGKEDLNDTEKRIFLQSPSYCNMIRKMVIGITGDHSIIVYILDPRNPDLAYTDGKRVYINTLHPSFFIEPIKDITVYCLALAVHESLHPLFTCFKYLDDVAAERKGEDGNMKRLRKDVFNIVEDARIERIARYKFPGVSYAIDEFNEFLFKEEIDVDKLCDVEILIQWLLDFVSVDKERKEIPDHLKNVWEQIKPFATNAKFSETCGRCYYYSKRIVKLLEPYLPRNKKIENMQQKPENSQGNETDENAQTGEGGSGNGSSSNGKAQQNNSQGNSGGNNNQGNNGKANANGQSGGNQNSASGSQQGNGNGTLEQGSNGSGNANQNSSQQNKGNQAGGEASCQGLSDEEIKAAAEAISNMLRGSLEDSYKEHLKEISNIASDAKTMSQLNSECGKECTVVANYGKYSLLEYYEIIRSSVSAVIKNLKKGLKNIINYNVDEMSRYLHTGKIDAKSLSRMPTGAICAKRIEKNEEADLNITVLVDMSGSMGGYEIMQAKAACVVLYEVCKELNIPITVLGFQEGTPTRIHYFADTSLKGKYAYTGIAQMFADGGTPLNDALKYLPIHLKKVQQADKLVIVITDGVPNGGPDASAASVKKLSNLSKVYGLGIGGRIAALENIFGKRYIKIDSVEKLPKELCKIIEKNLFRR